MSYRILLAKLLPSNRIEDVLDGNLYMNTDKYYSALDKSDFVRSDEDEDVDKVLQIKQISIADKDRNWVPIGGVKSPALFRSNSRDNINIFCMYALTDKPDYSFDHKNLSFGDTAVVITNAKEFTERFRKAAELAGRKLHHGPVTYVNRNVFHGAMGPFRKFDKFNYQNEFRFVLYGGDGNAITFSIGNIRDISFVIPSSDIRKITPPKRNS